MVYTIRIQDKSEKAKSLINMLKALKDDFDFIEIIEDNNDLNEIALLNELEARYNSFVIAKEGKDWNNLMKEL